MPLSSNSDKLDYLNLGNKIEQTYGLIGDFLVLWLLDIFFGLFAMASYDIFIVTSLQGIVSNKKNKSYKEICYSSMHFFILFVILIFVSESSGLFSLCYCVFCLISMFQATKILKNERNLRKYLKLLQYFLIPLMCFEILLQTLYQIPFHNYLSKDNED